MHALLILTIVTSPEFLAGATGVILPGRTGDIYVFGFADVSHRKGLLVFTEERKLGAGVRFAFE